MSGRFAESSSSAPVKCPVGLWSKGLIQSVLVCGDGLCTSLPCPRVPAWSLGPEIEGAAMALHCRMGKGLGRCLKGPMNLSAVLNGIDNTV